MSFTTQFLAPSLLSTHLYRTLTALVVVMSVSPSVLQAEQSAVIRSSDRSPIMLAQADEQSEARAMVKLMNQLDGLNRDLSRLRGKIEELGNSILQAEKRQKDMYLDLDTRLRRIAKTNAELADNAKKNGELMSALRERINRLEQSVANAPMSSLLTPETGGQPGGSQRMNAVVHGAYENAMVKYRAREYEEAIKAFQGIVSRFPDHALAVNAQYWTGDSFYQLRLYSAAVDAQKLLMVSYPDSPKVPDALLNMGSAQLGLGEPASARESWERLIANYPESRAATKARDRLKRLP